MILTAILAAYLWLPGLDIVREVNKEGTLWGVVGYDRDTQRGSWIEVSAGCYWTWLWRPTPGHGAITHLIHRTDLGPRAFSLVHESGLVRDEYIPDSAWCTPLPKP